MRQVAGIQADTLSGVKAEIVDAGAGIELHPRSTGDAAEMWEIIDRNRDDLRAWLPWIDTTRSALDVRRHSQFSSSAFDHLQAFEYAIRVDGRVCGVVGTHEIDWNNRSTSIGYWLVPQGRGRGVMTRAVAALLDRCIDRFRMHRFEIRCVVENEKSRAIPERLDFVFEGTLAGAYFLHERYRDIALYAMTAERWKARPQ